MNMTRRDTLKALASISAAPAATAAVAVPHTPSPEAPSYPEATSDELLRQIDILLSLIASKRGFAYDQKKDSIQIYLPYYCDRKEISGKFINAHPTARAYGEFHIFADCNRLIVTLNRFVNAEEEDGKDKQLSNDETWAYADIKEENLIDYRVGERGIFVSTDIIID